MINLPNQRRERIRLACRCVGASLYLSDLARPTCIAIPVIKPTAGEIADAVERAVLALSANGFSDVLPARDARLGLWCITVDLGMLAL